MANSQHTIGLDFKKLVETFSEICPDFNDNNPSDKSQSLGFASKVLFELSPKIKNLKKNSNDEMWRLDFFKEKNMEASTSSSSSRSSLVTNSVFVYTYRFNRPTNVQPRLKDNKLYLTLKQATLLATAKLCRVTPLNLQPTDVILLTPLARAIFIPKNIPKIALDLSRLTGRAITCCEVLNIVISSCQTDGFHLADSACHVAIVATQIIYTDAVQREKMRAKTLRVYKKHGKEFDANQYEVYARHSKVYATELRTIVQQVNALEVESTVAKQPSSSSNDKNFNLTTTINKIFKRSDDPLTGSTIDVKPIDFNMLKLNEEKPPASSTSDTSNNVPSKLLTVNITDYKTLKENVIGSQSKSSTSKESTESKNINKTKEAKNVNKSNETKTAATSKSLIPNDYRYYEMFEPDDEFNVFEVDIEEREEFRDYGFMGSLDEFY